MKKTFWYATIILAAILLAGCGKAAEVVGRGSLPPMPKAMDETALSAPARPAESGGSFPSEPVALSNESGDEDGTAPAETPNRMIVRTAQLELSVKNPKAAADSISALAAKMGGFVASTDIRTEAEESGVITYGSITIRVPAEKYDETIQRLRKIGKEMSYSSQSKDVSKEYIDLNARLRNLQAAEKRLQQIMAQAKTTKDVLSVYRELNQVQGQIEQLKGRIEYLKHSAALATITVQLEQESTTKVSVGKWNVGAQAAKAAEFLIKTFKMLITLLIWLVIYFLPIAVVLYIVIGIPTKLIVRRVKRNLNAEKAKSEQTPTTAK